MNKNLHPSKKIYFFLIMLLSLLPGINNVKAQTPGLIIKPANSPGNSVLDPDLDGYVSQKTNGVQLGFTIPPNNDVFQSEIPYVALIRPDPLGDILRGPVGGYSDIVGIDAAGNNAILTYNDGTNLLFRFRLGGYAPNSKSYSILIDTDGKFGFTGPNADPNAVPGNPGFEVEIVLETNFNVKAFNVDGTTTPILVASALYDTNCQKSVAVSTAGGDPDYFYDFYLPLSSLSTLFTASTPLRIVAVTTMNPYPAIGNNLSDIGGVTTGSNVDAIFETLIDSQTPTVPGTEVLDRTTCPTITGSYTTASTTVSGTSTEANGTLIQVYKNGVAAGAPVTVTSGAWSRNGLTFVATDVITATATATVSNKGTSFANCSSKTVTAGCTPPSAPTAFNFSASGKITVTFPTAVIGTTITVYNSDGTTWKSGAATVGNTTLQLSGGTPVTTNGSKVPDGTYYATVTVNGCESTRFSGCFGKTTTAIPTINSPILSGATNVTGTGISGDFITVYANAVKVATTSVTASNTWSVNIPTLTCSDAITASQSRVAVILSGNGDGGCVSNAVGSVTFQYAKPSINSMGCNSSPPTSISGFSTEIGATIQLYKTTNLVAPIGSITVATGGTWTISAISPALSSGDIIEAKVAANGCVTASGYSNQVTISLQTSLTGYTIGITAPTEGQTSVSGTISGVSYPVTLNIYEDETLVGSGVSIVSDGPWTISGLSGVIPKDLYVGGKLKVTLTSATGCESVLSAELATVQCISPAMPTYTGGSMSYCYGGAGQLTLTTSQTGVIYQLVNGSGQSQGAAIAGTGGIITLYTNQLTSNLLNIYVKAYKIGSSTCSTTSVTAINFDNQLASPSVTFTSTSLSVAKGTTSVNLPYSAKSVATNAATNYTIDYPASVNSQGFTDITTPTAIPASPIVLTVPSNPAIGTYPGTITLYQASGCTASYSFTITVYGASSPPVISVQPSNTTICSNTTTNLSVTAVNATGYQWWSNSTYSGTYSSISGATSINYTTPSLTSTIYYRVVVSNGNGSTTSNVATVTVNALPAIGLTVGGTGSICSGTSTNVTVALSVSGTNYQLRNNSGNVNVGTQVTGTSGTISLPTGNLSSTTTFNVLATTVSTSCPAQLTGTATVTVTAVPTATISYAGSPFCNSLGTAQPVTRTGTADGTYAALPSGLTIDGATGAITPSSSTAGTYTVTYTIAAAGGCGIVTATSSVTINLDGSWTGSLSTDWNTPGNWACNQLPTATTDVTIPSSPTKYPVISGADVTISSTGKLQIQNGATLTLDSVPLLTFQSGATITTGIGSKIILKSGSRYLNLSSSTPTLKMQRQLTGTKGWRMVASPVATIYADMFKYPLVTQGFTNSTDSTLQPNLMWWDETDAGTTLQGWRKPANLADAISAGRGYFHYIFNGAGIQNKLGTINTGFNYSDVLPQTMSVTGVENYNGSLNYNYYLTYTARATSQTPSVSDSTYYDLNALDQGWNLIGNPTASTLDWDASSGWTKTNVDNSIYVWDPLAQSGNGEYLTWNGTMGTLGNGKIPPFQAFWVHANTASPTPTISFTNVAKTTTVGTFRRSPAINETVCIPLTLSGHQMQTTSFISFDNNGIVGPDSRDAYRLESMNDTWIELYTLSSPHNVSPLVINNLPLQDTSLVNIPLFVGGQINGAGISDRYTLQWQIPANWPSDWNISLQDHQASKAISMTDNTYYTFNYTSVAVKPATNNIMYSPKQLVKHLSKTSQTTSNTPPFSIIISKGGKPVEYMEPKPHFLPDYTNPFSNSTILRFSLPESAQVFMNVYNLSGICIETLTNAVYPAGFTEIEWQPRNSIPGMYFIRFICGDTVETRKVILKN